MPALLALLPLLPNFLVPLSSAFAFLLLAPAAFCFVGLLHLALCSLLLTFSSLLYATSSLLFSLESCLFLLLRFVSASDVSLVLSALLLLLLAFDGLLALAFLGPTGGGLAQRIGLLGPLLGDDVSSRKVFPPDHTGLDPLLAAQQTTDFSASWSPERFGRSSHPAFSPSFPPLLLLLSGFLLSSHQDRHLHRHRHR